MKKLTLILTILVAFTIFGKAQSPILTDTLIVNNQDTLFLKFYHDEFTDHDYPFVMWSKIYLVKEYKQSDTTFISMRYNYQYSLSQNDSIKNPYGTNYFTYEFVKDYIYTQGEDMKRTLSLYQLLNRKNRILY